MNTLPSKLEMKRNCRNWILYILSISPEHYYTKQEIYDLLKDKEEYDNINKKPILDYPSYCGDGVYSSITKLVKENLLEKRRYGRFFGYKIITPFVYT